MQTVAAESDDMKYEVSREGKVIGEYDRDMLLTLMRNNTLYGTDCYRHWSMDSWQPLKSLLTEQRSKTVKSAILKISIFVLIWFCLGMAAKLLMWPSVSESQVSKGGKILAPVATVKPPPQNLTVKNLVLRVFWWVFFKRWRD